MAKGIAEHARVGLGEYEHHGSSTADVRDAFLWQIRLDLPHVLEELRGLDGSDDALRGWAIRWHLHEAWILDVARRTLARWGELPIVARHLQWAQVAVKGELVPEPPAICWAPTIETEHQFRKRVDEYIADVRRLADAVLVKTSPKPNLARDLRALVQFQVKGDDLETVATEHFGATHEDAARKALASSAKLIGLTLRK